MDDAPDLGGVFACAGRMQRAMADLSGLRADGQADTRPWLDHGLWAPGAPPLQHDAPPAGAPAGSVPPDYPFVRVERDLV